MSVHAEVAVSGALRYCAPSAWSRMCKGMCECMCMYVYVYVCLCVCMCVYVYGHEHGVDKGTGTGSVREGEEDPQHYLNTRDG